jgi:hypothetical protein
MPSPEALEFGAKAVEAAIQVGEDSGLNLASILRKATTRDAGEMRSMLQENGLISRSPDNVLLDPSKTLELEPHWSCENVDDASRSVAELTAKLVRPASLRWNGIDVAAAPGDSAQTIRKAYDAGWNAWMNSPERVEADRILVAKIAAQDAERAAANRQAVEAFQGAPGRSESELIPALQAGAKEGYWAHWFPYALQSLRNPTEMKTAANYYAREFPDLATKNLASGIGRYAPDGTQDAWREALTQMPKAPSV